MAVRWPLGYSPAFHVWQRVESSGDARDDLEGVVGGKVFVSLQPQVNVGESRAIEIYNGLVDALKIEIGPSETRMRTLGGIGGLIRTGSSGI